MKRKITAAHGTTVPLEDKPITAITAPDLKAAAGGASGGIAG